MVDTTKTQIPWQFVHNIAANAEWTPGLRETVLANLK